MAKSRGSEIAAVLAFLLVGVVVIVLRSGSHLTGWPLLALVACATLVFPTSDFLSRRIFLNTIIFAGFIPMLWWLPGTMFPMGRGTLVIALVLAGASGWLVLHFGRRRGLRSVVPQLRSADILPFVAGGAAALTLSRSFTVSTSADALKLATWSWDNASHFNIYYLIRRLGSVTAIAPPSADGGLWGSHSYPQGFHSLMAAISEMVYGPFTGSSESELLLYFRASAAVTVLAVVILVSGLSSIRSVRSHFWLTLPAIAFATTAWIIGPGAVAVFGGFSNFYLGCTLLAALVLAAQQITVENYATTIVICSAASVGMAHNWVLLLLLAIPAAFLVSIATWNLWPELFRRQIALSAVSVAAAIAGLSCAAWQMRSLPADSVLVTPGGIEHSDYGFTLLLIALCAAAAIALLAHLRIRHRLALTFSERTGLLLLTPVAGGVALICMAVFQLQLTSKLSYYFYKSALAVGLIAVLCLAIGAIELISHLSLKRFSARTQIAVAIVCSLGATQLFGFAIPGLKDVGLPATATGMAQVQIQDSLLSESRPHVDKLLALARMDATRPFIYVGYDETINPILAAQWSLALGGHYSDTYSELVSYMAPMSKGPQYVPQSIEPILAANPLITVVIDANIVDSLRAAMPQYASRIRTFE